jgi:hypothetical protein
MWSKLASAPARAPPGCAAAPRRLSVHPFQAFSPAVRAACCAVRHAAPHPRVSWARAPVAPRGFSSGLLAARAELLCRPFSLLRPLTPEKPSLPRGQTQHAHTHTPFCHAASRPKKHRGALHCGPESSRARLGIAAGAPLGCLATPELRASREYHQAARSEKFQVQRQKRAPGARDVTGRMASGQVVRRVRWASGHVVGGGREGMMTSRLLGWGA